MKRVKKTISRKHAQALHVEIRRCHRDIETVERLEQHAKDDLVDAKKREQALQVQLDGLTVRHQKMGEDLGRANTREIATRQVADILIDGVNVLSAATNNEALSRTLVSLGRDARAQLEKAKTNGTGAHA